MRFPCLFLNIGDFWQFFRQFFQKILNIAHSIEFDKIRYLFKNSHQINKKDENVPIVTVDLMADHLSCTTNDFRYHSSALLSLIFTKFSRKIIIPP